jgi:sec-independent protein translocase protein TatC
LRSRIIWSLAGVAIGTVISLMFGKEILDIIFQPLFRVQYENGLPPQLQALAPTAGFTAYLKVGFLAGLILTMPWVIFQVWRFVASGLYGHERRFVRYLIPSTTLLFTIGVFFLYFIVLPVVLQFFISFNKTFDLPDLTPSAFQSLLLGDSEPVIKPPESVGTMQIPILSQDPSSPQTGETWVNRSSRRLIVQTESGPLSTPMIPGTTSTPMQSQFAVDFYISFVLMLALAFGIAFETPVVVFFLAWSGIVPTATMVRSRRYILLATVIAAALLTPPDVISQLLLAGPMYLLFELGVLVARFAERKPSAVSTDS